MQRFAAFVDDTAHALCALMPVLNSAAGHTHCVIVLCAPRLKRRIGRFTNAAARQAWRADWCAQLRGSLAPQLAGLAPALSLEWVQAETPLPSLVRTLRQQHGAALRLLDARCQRLGQVAAPLVAGQAPAPGRVAAPVAVASSLSLMLALAD